MDEERMMEEITSPELSMFREKTTFDMPLEDGNILMDDDIKYQEYLQQNKGGKRKRNTRKKRSKHSRRRRTHRRRK